MLLDRGTQNSPLKTLEDSEQQKTSLSSPETEKAEENLSQSGKSKIPLFPVVDKRLEEVKEWSSPQIAKLD